MKKGIVGATAGAMLLLSAPPAFAHDCYVANKPAGAGAVTEADLKEAGKSGKLVAPGAFFELSSELEGAPDIFIRGGDKPPKGEEFFVGQGSLPEQPKDNGSPTNGVQRLQFPE